MGALSLSLLLLGSAVAQPAPARAALPRATWLHARWLQGVPDADVRALAATLRRHRVTTVHPALSPGAARPLPGGGRGWLADPGRARAFVRALRRDVPGVRVVPYKGFVRCFGGERWAASTAAAAVASAEALGADGVQLDMECPGLDGADAARFADLLHETKRRLGGRVLSLAMPNLAPSAARPPDAPWRDFPGLPDVPGVGPRAWEVAFAHADEVAVMMYDTWLPPGSQAAYAALVEFEARAAAWHAARAGRRFFAGLRVSALRECRPGVPRRCHEPSVENPPNALAGLARALADPAVRERLAGLALFRLDVVDQPAFRRGPAADRLAALDAF